MRFSALLRKELRECLPWLLLAMITFIAVSSIILREETYSENLGYRHIRFTPGTIINSYELTHYPKMHETGPWLLFLSLGLGLALGVRQFWLPNFTRTWSFLLHRSVNRQTILGAKLLAASLTLMISLGLTWMALYRYICQPEVLVIPPSFRVFIEGLIFIMLGFISYLGTALSGLSRTKWYSTKMFGIFYATLVIIMFAQFRYTWLLVIIIVSIVILLSQIFNIFLRREF
jgi:hypothetical protein